MWSLGGWFLMTMVPRKNMNRTATPFWQLLWNQGSIVFCGSEKGYVWGFKAVLNVLGTRGCRGCVQRQEMYSSRTRNTAIEMYLVCCTPFLRALRRMSSAPVLDHDVNTIDVHVVLSSPRNARRKKQNVIPHLSWKQYRGMLQTSSCSNLSSWRPKRRLQFYLGYKTRTKGHTTTAACYTKRTKHHLLLLLYPPLLLLVTQNKQNTTILLLK